jgi:hypothetical protein
MSESSTSAPRPEPSAVDKTKAADKAQVAKERREGPVSKPGGFENDPDDPTNPNEAIERHRRKLRP